MSGSFRVGIVGSGFGASTHLPALRAHARFEVVALASPRNAARIGAEQRIERTFASCAEMLAGCELDAVVVASPPFAHHDDVLAALRAGKHVLCEKPFALDVAQAEAMIAAEGAAGTACAIAHEFRFRPERIALAELVGNAHLDPIREIEYTQLMGFLRAKEMRPRGWWFQRARGGGVAGAMLSHAIDASNALLGMVPVAVVGSLRTANPQRFDADGEFTSEVDDGAFALLRYANGVVTRLTVDGTTAVNAFTFAVHGETRTAVCSGKAFADQRLFSVDDEETNELECAPSRYARFAAINGNVPPMMELYDAWVAKIEGSTDAPAIGQALPSFADALATQRVLAAVGYGS
ncbi:MAG: Gfo/Idh/MocA family oxidoreductase [Candidatus Eremiobacteraeota bacterium]|nr:Gfo/Idh/MocA family oxidoreductase [Candidatus Eremiobacteraeota bacterium]